MQNELKEKEGGNEGEREDSSVEGRTAPYFFFFLDVSRKS